MFGQDMVLVLLLDLLLPRGIMLWPTKFSKEGIGNIQLANCKWNSICNFAWWLKTSRIRQNNTMIAQKISGNATQRLPPDNPSLKCTAETSKHCPVDLTPQPRVPPRWSAWTQQAMNHPYSALLCQFCLFASFNAKWMLLHFVLFHLSHCCWSQIHGTTTAFYSSTAPFFSSELKETLFGHSLSLAFATLVWKLLFPGRWRRVQCFCWESLEDPGEKNKWWTLLGLNIIMESTKAKYSLMFGGIFLLLFIGTSKWKYCWWFRNPTFTSWYEKNIPFFIGFHR